MIKIKLDVSTPEKLIHMLDLLNEIQDPTQKISALAQAVPKFSKVKDWLNCTPEQAEAMDQALQKSAAECLRPLAQLSQIPNPRSESPPEETTDLEGARSFALTVSGALLSAAVLAHERNWSLWDWSLYPVSLGLTIAAQIAGEVFRNLCCSRSAR